MLTTIKTYSMMSLQVDRMIDLLKNILNSLTKKDLGYISLTYALFI